MNIFAPLNFSQQTNFTMEEILKLIERKKQVEPVVKWEHLQELVELILQVSQEEVNQTQEKPADTAPKQ